ncbi:hypothetical protein GCM10009583_02140 [Ornithinicoccus hortensis]
MFSGLVPPDPRCATISGAAQSVGSAVALAVAPSGAATATSAVALPITAPRTTFVRMYVVARLMPAPFPWDPQQAI